MNFINYLVGSVEEKTVTKDEFSVTKLSTYEEVQRIISGLKKGEGYIIDLDGAEKPKAQRMLDLLSGACYALDARLDKIKNKMYLILPKTIAVKSKKK